MNYGRKIDGQKERQIDSLPTVNEDNREECF